MKIDLSSLLNQNQDANRQEEKQINKAGQDFKTVKELQEHARNKEVYKKLQANIKAGERGRASILKKIKQGENPIAVLLRAVECIGNMCGDEAFHKQARDDLLVIYGRGFLEVAPLQIELEEVTARLEKLIAAEKREKNEDNKKRIRSAITVHREKIEELNWLINGAPL